MIVIERQAFYKVLLTLIFILSLNDALRIYFGVLSWVPILLVCFFCFKPKLIFGFYSFLWVLFITIIIFNSIFSDNPINTLGRALKITAIFIFITIFYKGLFQKENILSALRFAVYLTVFANIVLIALSIIAGYDELAWLGGGGRWETALAKPGTLYYAGATFILLYFYDYLFKSNYSGLKGFLGWLMFLLSVSVVLFDGSRTAIISLFFAISILFISSKNFKLKLLSIFIILVVMLPLFYYMVLYDVFDFNRFGLMVGSESLKSLDPVRYMLLKDSMGWILSNNPIFIGNGFSTTIENNTFELVVHNAFVLIWEKLGLVALIVFVFIIVTPIFNVFFLPVYRASSARFLVISFWFVFFVILVFHPFATEYGPWYFYMLLIFFMGSNRNRNVSTSFEPVK